MRENNEVAMIYPEISMVNLILNPGSLSTRATILYRGGAQDFFWEIIFETSWLKIDGETLLVCELRAMAHRNSSGKSIKNGNFP